MAATRRKRSEKIPLVKEAGLAIAERQGKPRRMGYLNLAKSKGGALVSCSFVRSVMNLASGPTLMRVPGDVAHCSGMMSPSCYDLISPSVPR